MITAEGIRSEFVWPLAKDLAKPQRGQQLYKDDPFLRCVESLVDNRRAWLPIVGKTKRTEPEPKLAAWLVKQRDKMQSVEKLNHWSKNVTINVKEFPLAPNSKRIIATAKSILYLIDSTNDLVECIGAAFGQNAKTESAGILDVSIPAVVFISNSVESGGRAFSGDPFTGQVSAFSRIFCSDIMGEKERNFVPYYPHQLYTQFFNKNGKKVANKGANILQSLADLIITAKGVLIEPSEWRVL